MPANRTNTRLSPDRYRGRQTYFVTICTARSARHLSAPAVSENVQRILLECAASQSFVLHAFCLMPDHIKQHTGYEFRQRFHDRLWKKSYYDYIIRPPDSIENVACYIWWNPVRKSLCAHPSEFPFTGSQTIDWIRRSSKALQWSAPWKSKTPA